jgi:flagellar basal-body rod protein FlgG
MLKGILEATAGMMARGVQLEKVSQNLANANTTGYKSEHLAYTSLIDQEIARLQMQGERGLELLAPGQYTNYDSGAMMTTGNDLDVALSGNGFFVVRNQSGEEFYTRNGNFYRNDQGTLVTADNLQVVGDSGEIQLETGRVTISVNGSISQRGSEIDQLKVVTISDNTSLRSVGKSLYTIASPTATADPVESPEVRQGILEQSNVNIVTEMIDLIELQRIFKFTQRALQSQSDTLGLAVNSVGTLGR